MAGPVVGLLRCTYPVLSLTFTEWGLTVETMPRVRFATMDGLPSNANGWEHYVFQWEAISATGRTYRGDYKQGAGIGWQLCEDTARASIWAEIAEAGALRTDDDIADWMRDIGVDDPADVIGLYHAILGMRRFYDRCTAVEREALDAFAEGD